MIEIEADFFALFIVSVFVIGFLTGSVVEQRAKKKRGK